VETLEAIESRRQVRAYAEQPIERDALERVVRAGARSPSARNRQRWDFVVVTDREQLARLSRVWRGAAWVGGAAAAIALVVPATDDPGEREGIRFDLGQAVMSMLLAATDLGLGSGQAGCEDQDLARAVLGLPADRECAMLVAVGVPADGPVHRLRRVDRRPFADVVHVGRWHGRSDR
jgi:nitroreductase